MPLSRSRVAVAAAFLAQGLVLLSLTTRLPELQDEWGLSDVALSLVLLMMILLAGVGSVVAEALAKRRDSALLLRAGLLLVGVAVPVICLAPTTAVFVAGVAAYGLALGVVDASTNMQAVALEHRYERPILPSFHGAWTLGGVLGALLTLATSDLPLEAGAALGVIPLSVAFAAFLPRDHGPTELAAQVAVPWRPIVLVGIAMVLFYMVDTAVQTWGPLFLDHTFSTPERYVSLSALGYLLASGAVRIAGDPLVRRYGAVAVLRVGALVGAAALAVVVFSTSWPMAVAGFSLLGAGVAVVAPLSFSAAARIAGGEGLDPAVRQARVDAVIARFNQFNYLGALLGSVMTGLVGADSLRVGFAVPMVLVLGIIPLAAAFTPRVAASVRG
ncbi:MFS transporter [Nocardioides lianchengensis]|uniref:Predicted arabinose efflux permease, MFS family n=1 Tax=Nocardioides lianchengensis TaxID=1045774 RepID=A0A1G6K0C8_9ACTN|nr:MFS transporter [Nocardioides lianchengensis]NYG08843.1 MFS family permease [Nocardioides lianchengensis]SDC24509.1 Predicted arabinose efflux permease, MFS family [Nocardioides lianchengensis]